MAMGRSTRVRGSGNRSAWQGGSSLHPPVQRRGAFSSRQFLPSNLSASYKGRSRDAPAFVLALAIGERFFREAEEGAEKLGQAVRRTESGPQGLKCLRENPVLNARERSRRPIRLRRKPVQLKKQQVNAALRRRRSASQR